MFAKILISMIATTGFGFELRAEPAAEAVESLWKFSDAVVEKGGLDALRASEKASVGKALNSADSAEKMVRSLSHRAEVLNGILAGVRDGTLAVKEGYIREEFKLNDAIDTYFKALGTAKKGGAGELSILQQIEERSAKLPAEQQAGMNARTYVLSNYKQIKERVLSKDGCGGASCAKKYDPDTLEKIRNTSDDDFIEHLVRNVLRDEADSLPASLKKSVGEDVDGTFSFSCIKK